VRSRVSKKEGTRGKKSIERQRNNNGEGRKREESILIRWRESDQIKKWSKGGEDENTRGK